MRPTLGSQLRGRLGGLATAAGRPGEAFNWAAIAVADLAG